MTNCRSTPQSIRHPQRFLKEQSAAGCARGSRLGLSCAPPSRSARLPLTKLHGNCVARHAVTVLIRRGLIHDGTTRRVCNRLHHYFGRSCSGLAAGAWARADPMRTTRRGNGNGSGNINHRHHHHHHTTTAGSWPRRYHLTAWRGDRGGDYGGSWPRRHDGWRHDGWRHGGARLCSRAA